MKKLLILLLLSIGLFSCDNEYLSNGESLINRQKETTLEVLNKIDTTEIYYVVVQDETLYAVSKDKVVEYKVTDCSADLDLFASLFIICLVLLFMVTYILN